MKRNVILNSFCKGLLLLVTSTISWVAADAAQPQAKDKKLVWSFKDFKNLGNSTAASATIGVKGEVVR